MQILSGYSPFTEDEIKEFVSNSTPVTNSDFKLEKGKEDYGWVKFYFKNNKEEFTTTLSLAMSNLTEPVLFFKNFIDLKEDIAIFFDDELISEPLLYASPIDENNIRFFIADAKSINDKIENNEVEYDDDYKFGLSDYEIRCDVVVNKKKLLKEFYRAVKNIMKDFIPYDEHLYDIDYNNWKDNLRKIVLYCK